MAFTSKTDNKAGRRNSALRSGLVAVSTAAAGLCSAMTARADITNGFSSFAPVNIVGVTTAGNIGYSATGSTFVLTDNRGSEAVSGFNTTLQNVSSFDCTYTYTEPTATSGVADGITFCIQDSSAGTAAIGTGGGGLGYGTIANSASLEFNIYTGYTVGSAYATGGTVNNTYAAPTNISLRSGDPIQVTLEYFNNTLTENLVDLNTNASYGRIFTGVTIPTATGSSTAYVGFTGGTGGSTATQQVSNFTFVSGTGPAGVRLYQPIAISGYNQQGVISVAGGQSSVTATMDAGTAKTGDTWYEKGWNTFNTSTGLPTSGSTFTSQYDSSHVFQMANYSANDVVLLSKASPTATVGFNVPSAYSTLSFLESCGNGPSSFKVTINYADGAPATTGLSVITPDWFNGGPSAYYTAGRDTLTSNPASQPDTYAQGTGAGTGPNLYEEDLILPDSTDPIASLSLTFSGTNAGTNMMIFAVSGVVANSAPIVTYTGATIAGKFDTSTINFSQNSGGTITPVAFSNGDQVIFDDTAVDMTHAITVATVAGGIKTGGLIFNNTSATNAYTFTGAGIGGPGGISVNGGGTVNLNNPNTFSGGAYINSGTLNIGTGGTLASAVISVSSGATFSVNGGTLTGTGINLSDSGTVNYSPAALSLAGLSGTGVLNSTNATATNLTLTGSSAFSGSASLGAGSVTVNANGSSVALTGSDSYSGGTFLKAGGLLIGNSLSLGSGTLYLQGGSFGATGGPVNFSNFITGSALILPSGSTLLEISGQTNNFTGPVVIQSGSTLQLDTAGSIGGINGANAATGSVTVASGASLSIKDTSGYLGLTGGVPGGAPISLVLSGTGVGNNGALTTPANTGGTVTWAGNINASGPVTIAPGIGSTLALTGSITSGANTSGAILYGSNSNDSNYSVITIAPPTPTSNTYLGESQVAGDNGGTFATITVGLGNSNGFSPAAGLNFIPGGTGALSVELNGYNQSIQYLTGGANSNYQLSNTSPVTSTLSITNGNNSTGVPQTFGVQIIGNIAVVKTGTGNQSFIGNSTYSGGTNIKAGTLTVGTNTALGTGPVTVSGGTLAFSAPSSITGFSSFTTTGASASISGNVLQLTNIVNGGYNETASAFAAQPVSINDAKGFTASFTYNPTPETYDSEADGATFVIQNSAAGSSALGGGGGGFGYTGINKSVALTFDIFYENPQFVGIATNGAASSTTNSYLFDNYGSDPINVAVTYANGVLTEVLTDTTGAAGNATTTTFSYPVDIAQQLGGAANGVSSGYVGFTAAGGGVGATQQFSNFVFGGGGNQPVGIANSVTAAPGTTSYLQVATSTGSSTQNIGALSIGAQATLYVTIANGSSGRAVLAPTSLSIAGTIGAFTGRLDLGGNDLDVPSSGTTIAMVTSMLKQGYAGGAWNGNGIASSAASADTSHLTALGAIVNDNGSGTPLYGNNGTISTTFDGATPADGDILVKYTYYGDANLDGAVDGSDYSLIDNAFLNNSTMGSTALTGWLNGDFNYDGVINGSDYTLIDNAFNQQGTSLGSNPLAQIAATVGGSAVPEPASLSILAISSLALLGRRRRSSRIEN